MFLYCRLLVSGRLYGAGKSHFGVVLCAVLQKYLGDKPVHRLALDSYEAPERPTRLSSWFAGLLLREVLRMKDPQGRKLFARSQLQLEDPSDIVEVLDAITAALTDKDEFLFLHLDEFILEGKKFDALFPSSQDIDRYYDIWDDVLTKIQKTARVFLYVCGKTPYLDMIGLRLGGRSPTEVSALG
jgi:hypothetical protein